MTKIKHGVCIGRYQPAHAGHIHLIKIAASQVERLLVLIGSANACRSIKNPWTYAERVHMLTLKLRTAGVTNVTFAPLNDHPYADSQWISDVRSTVAHYRFVDPVLFGHMKDGNDYLEWFPDWKFRNVESTFKINATMVREEMFKTNSQEMPATVRDDYAYYRAEKIRFEKYPFPETLNFNCADAVVICLGHVLLIQRARAPGRGAWALPGGFKNRDETFIETAYRELKEETNLRVPEKILKKSMVRTQLFDSPTRSYGIPRNTLAVLIEIQPDADGSLPRANGADDAADVRWVPIDEALTSYVLYDDHAAIVSSMTGVVPPPAYMNGQ